LAQAFDETIKAPDLSDHVLFIVIGTAWVAVVAFVVAICRAAARGDVLPLQRPADLLSGADAGLSASPTVSTRVPRRDAPSSAQTMNPNAAEQILEAWTVAYLP
jgi:hypothetical protein